MDSGSTAYWVAESGTTPESTPVLGQVQLSRKTISADTEFSKELLVEASQDIEAIIRNELIRVIALGIDNAAVNGSGTSNEPTGILATSGIGTVEAGDPDGAAMTWGDAVQLKAAIRTQNGDTGTIGYLTNPTLAAKLESTEKATNTAQFIFEDAEDGFGRIGGKRCGVSTVCPNDGTKGSGTDLSTIIAGVWSELMLGYWGRRARHRCRYVFETHPASDRDHRQQLLRHRGQAP